MAEQTASQPPPSLRPVSSARRLWERYRRARGARVGLYLVTAFSLTAFLAPFLAHRLPVFWKDAATGEWSWPLIHEFFAPSDTTEPLLEKAINFLFLFIPLSLLAWKAMNKYFPDLGRKDSKLISLLFGALFSATIWMSIGGMVIQGGGNDWLYHEVAPVPEIDDIENPGAFWGRLVQHDMDAGGPFTKENRESFEQWPADEKATKAWQPLAPRLRTIFTDAAPPTVFEGNEGKRWLIGPIQTLIDGPAMATVAELEQMVGAQLPGFANADTAQRLDAARLNRQLLETAFPGLLTPMRQFRGTFLLLVACTLLTLFGLTYIFMAGAYQFSLSPRWLLLLLLAFVVALPFAMVGPRHDHTPYRQLAASGGGTGLFPLIPYGPNEQGFGPRLPPSWFTESPLLTADAIRSWDRLSAQLAAPSGTEAKHIVELLKNDHPDTLENLTSEEGRAALVTAMNSLIEKADIYQPSDSTARRGDLSLRPYLAEAAAGRELPPEHLARMNRLLVERAFPETIMPVNAIRWKKPQHVPGLHLLGTDESGRDVLVRIIHGARVSLSVGFVSVFLATVIGLVMGSLAAYYGGRVDLIISRFIEIMMCFPSFFLILAVIAVLDKRSIINIMLVIGITSWTGVARLIRGEMLRQKKMDYVSASIALGASDTRTIFRHILPNAMAPVLVSISFGITGAILTEASLSFIGFGVTPPTPTWGQLLSETRDSPLANWWLAVFPGIVLFISVIAYNMVGEAIRDTLDPRTNL